MSLSGTGGIDAVQATPSSSPLPIPTPPAGGARRLASILLARKDQLLRSRRRRGSSSSCGRGNAAAPSLSDSESLGSSSTKRALHDTISRNSSSGQSAATLQTLLSSPLKGSDGRGGGEGECSKHHLSHYEDLGDDNVLDGLQVIAEKEMNSFQRHIPGLQRHDIKTSTIRQHYYPEGGWGWVICACVFAIQVLTSGLQFSFGVLYTDLITLVGKEKTLEACWVGASCLAVSRVFSPLVVALCRRKSTRLTAVIGGLVIALSVLFSSFALQLHQVFLSWGVVLGIGIGMTRETANLMLGQYFKRRREFVEIISQSGCGIGITLFSVFFKEAIRSLSWRLGLQAVTGVVFSAFFLGIFYRSASLYHPQRRAILHLKNQKKKQVKDKKKVDDNKPPYFDTSSLKIRSVQVLLFSTALTSAGLYAPLFFLILGAQQEGLEDSSLVLLQTFLGFAYALGCIGVGLIVVKRSAQCHISRQYLCQGSFFGLGITILSLTAVRGYYGYVLFMWLYGLQLGGAHYSIKMLTLEKVRARQFSRAWGFIQGGTALPILFGIPATGYINAASSKMGYFFSSLLTIIGATSLFLLNYFKKNNPTPDTSVSFTTVDSHLPPETPFPVPVPTSLENSRNGSETMQGCHSQIPGPVNISSGSFREPVCTCGADPNAQIMPVPPCPAVGNSRIENQCRHPGYKRGWGKNISFASSVDIVNSRPEIGICTSDEALFDRYYDYMADCTTTCNKLDNFFAVSDFDRECMINQMGDSNCPKGFTRTRHLSQCQPVNFATNSLGRRLRQSSGVSFSEPERLAHLGRYPEGLPPPCQYPLRYQFALGHSNSDFMVPPVPGPPYFRGSLPRVIRRGVPLVEEITTSV